AEIAHAALHEASHAVVACVGRLQVGEVKLRTDARHRLAHSSDVLQARLRADKVRLLAPKLGLTNHLLAEMSWLVVTSHWPAIVRTAIALRALGDLGKAEVAALCGRLQ